MGRISNCEEGKVISWLCGRILHEKRERGSNIIFPIILRLFGENGKGTEIFWGKIKI